jgi:hypothetical protein
MNLQAVRGDTNIYDVTVLRQNVPVNLTGAKMWFTAKSDPRSGDPVAAISLNSTEDIYQVTPVDLPHGKFQVKLNPTDTDTLAADAYIYDVQIVETDGVVTTIASGVLHIVQDVTRAST